MNKKELIEVLAKKSKSHSKTEAGMYLNTFIEVVKNTLKSGKKVVIAGFGTFSVKKRAARTGVNPQTGQKIQISAMKVPKFKAGQDFKKIVK